MKSKELEHPKSLELDSLSLLLYVYYMLTSCGSLGTIGGLKSCGLLGTIGGLRALIPVEVYYIKNEWKLINKS